MELRHVRVHRATLLDELARHAPAVLAAVRARRGGRASAISTSFRLGVAAFAAGPSITLDYAVGEDRARRGGAGRHRLVRRRLLGRALGAGAQDAAGNVAVGAVAAGRGALLRALDGILTAVVGLEDVVLVVTDDAVLACPATARRT